MNIVVFTQGVSPIVEPILEKYGITAIVESGPRGSEDSVGRTRLSEFCKKRKIPYYWLTKPTRSGLIHFLKQYELDVAAVYSMSQLLPSEVLNLFPRGVINAHPSKLPAYRGPNPYFWTFYDGCYETALTIHYLDSGEDTGDIILQEPVSLIDPSNCKVAQTVDLRARVHEILAPTMLKALEKVDTGSASRVVQPKASPTVRARNITSENVAEILSDLPLPLNAAAMFFQNTLGMLPLRQFGFRRLSGDWCVKGVCPHKIRESFWKNNSDRIRLSRYGFAIPRPDGWVILKPRIGFLKFVLKLLRDRVRLEK